MVSPNLVKKQEAVSPIELNESTKNIFQIMYSAKNKSDDIDDDVPRISVSSLVSKLAFFYEKIRNAVDYDEEHRLRKNAIVRILHRQVVIEGFLKDSSTDELSSHLMSELIRGGYLPNNKIPESKIIEIAGLLKKYIRLKELVLDNLSVSFGLNSDVQKTRKIIKKRNNLVKRILVMAACEIEENLSPNPVKTAIVDRLFDVLSKNISLPPGLPYENDLSIQIYLSIARTYLKMDEEMLSFILFKYYNGHWVKIKNIGISDDKWEVDIKSVADKISDLGALIEQQLKHPLGKQLDKLTKVYALYYSVLAEVIEEDPVKAYAELQKGEKTFNASLRKVCVKKYKKAKAKLWRAAIRSIIYIFLTKSIFVVAIELPAVQWFGEAVNAVALAINVSFPAILLFLIVMSTKMPNEKNTDKIIAGVKEIAFLGQEKKNPIILRPASKRKPIVSTLFGILYFACFILTVYVIVRALYLINFNWVSVIIFLFFLAFVSFFSIVVTKGVKDLVIIRRKENLFTLIVDLFYMPITMAGRWLSSNFSRINVFVFIFDFILEAPFKILVDITEDWTKYVRERRENME